MVGVFVPASVKHASPSEPEGAESLRSTLIRGSVWMVAMRWSIRGIGLLSTIILARILDPADFGIVAMASLAIAFLEVLTAFGVDMALIQRQSMSRDFYDSAWTIRLVQLLVVAMATALIAPSAAEYFNDQRIVSAMQVLAVGIAFGAFENIGVVAFRQELNFDREFRFRVVAKIAGFLLTLGLAVTLRNYWALIIGTVCSNLILVLLSYVVHPYRPWFSIRRVRELWSFSQWMLARNIGMYVRRQSDRIILGRYFAADQLGFYSVSTEVANLTTTEVVWPMSRALFPGYARLKDDPQRLSEAYVNVLGFIAMLVLPIGAGMSMLADPLLRVALGEKWLEAGPALSWLAIHATVLAVSATVQQPLMAVGRMRRTTLLVWAQAIVSLPCLLVAAWQGSIVFVAKVQALISIALLPGFFLALTTLSLVSWRQICSALWRPTLGCLSLVGSILLVRALPYDGAPVQLLVETLTGGAAFVLTVGLLWWLAGRPTGTERTIADYAMARLG